MRLPAFRSAILRSIGPSSSGIAVADPNKADVGPLLDRRERRFHEKVHAFPVIAVTHPHDDPCLLRKAELGANEFACLVGAVPVRVAVQESLRADDDLLRGDRGEIANLLADAPCGKYHPVREPRDVL